MQNQIDLSIRVSKTLALGWYSFQQDMDNALGASHRQSLAHKKAKMQTGNTILQGKGAQ
jgi:hypothetical protein